MRRKSFFILIILLAVLTLANALGIPLKSGEICLNDENGENSFSYTGKVMRVQEKTDRIELQVNLKSRDGQLVDFDEDVLLFFYADEYTDRLSEELLRKTISFAASPELPKDNGNPHCFNYRKYLKSKGIGRIAVIKNYRIENCRLSFMDEYERTIYVMRKTFINAVSSEARGMITGVLFGDTGLIEEEVYEEFRENGTAHILAVSGLHIGIMYGIYKKIAGKRRSIAAITILFFLLFVYGSLAMWSSSATRAVLMIVISTLGRYTDRRSDLLTSMSIAAFILMIANPYVIFSAGFQMSFLAISSIAFLRPVMPEAIPDSLTTAVAVNVGLMVYQMYNFNHISFVSIIANIPIIYITGYFVPIAIAGFCAFSIGFGWGIARPVVEGFAIMLEKVNHSMNFGGHAGIDVISPPFFITVLVMTLIFFLSSETFYLMRSRKEYKKIACCIMAIFVVSTVGEIFTYSPVTHDDVVFADVGQGDCTHIRTGGKNILIDGGGSAERNVGKSVLKPYLLKNGAGRADALIATHRHTDHYKGLTELSQCMDAGKIYTEMTRGKNMQISKNVYIETLWPLTLKEGQTQDENKNCSVFMIHYGKYRVLITGDLDTEGESEMIAYYEGTGKLRADILKVGHHGSKTSTSTEFLKVVSPQIAVIQVGKNTYGHPTEETLKRLRNSGCMIFRNDIHGAIGVKFSKNKIKIHTIRLK